MSARYKHILYKFTRKYGTIGTLIIATPTSLNEETGAQTISETSYSFKIIVMPSRVWRSFVQTLAFIASNKNFTYGGNFDTSQRQIVVDRRLMPTVNPASIMNSRMTINSRNYIIEEFHEYENEGFNFLTVKEIIDGS